MIPQLNQTITRFTYTTNRRGDRSYVIAGTFKGRLVEGQIKKYEFRGSEATYNASLHLGPTPILQENDVIGVGDTKYTVTTVIATRDLDGQIKFQWTLLQIQP